VNVGDYGGFIERDGDIFLGAHYIADLYGCRGLSDPVFIERSLSRSALAANATILQSRFHHFAPGGVTGVLVLAESHISVHTWPEHDFAAVDIFMCGNAAIDKAIDIIKEEWRPRRMVSKTIMRGPDHWLMGAHDRVVGD